MAATTILSRLAAAMPRSIACRPESMKSAENSAKNVVPLPPGPNRRDKHQLAFLPAALEIAETPPPPTAAAIRKNITAQLTALPRRPPYSTAILTADNR